MSGFKCPDCGHSVEVASSLPDGPTECPRCHGQTHVPGVANARMTPASASPSTRRERIPRRLLVLAVLCPPLALLLVGDIFLAGFFAVWLIATFYTALIVVAPITLLRIRHVWRRDAMVSRPLRGPEAFTSLSAQPAQPPIQDPQTPGEGAVVIHLLWPGRWFLMDTKFRIIFDGTEIAATSILRPYERHIRTTTGSHVLQVTVPIRRARQYRLDCWKPGLYRAQLGYSRTWGNFARHCVCRMLAAPSPQGELAET